MTKDITGDGKEKSCFFEEIIFHNTNITFIKGLEVLNRRGMLTEAVQHMAKKFLRREISVEELRLYPYIDYCIKNGQGWSYEKINPEEVKILNKLDREEHIIYSPEKIMVSKPFYDYMQDVLAISYVQDFL